jgi:hypothetical protein
MRARKSSEIVGTNAAVIDCVTAACTNTTKLLQNTVENKQNKLQVLEEVTRHLGNFKPFSSAVPTTSISSLVMSSESKLIVLETPI